MKLRFIDNESLLTIKNNLTTWAPHFAKESGDWIEGALGRSPFKDTKYEVPDFALDMSADDPFATEARNVEIFYGNLKDVLTDSQASDERLWAGMCLGQFWPYVQYRWKIKSKCTPSNVADHFFFSQSARRSLTRNALARLWWIGRLTYDESNPDHYWLTRFVCESSDFILHSLERNFSNNPMIVKAFLHALIDAREKEGLIINTDTVGELAKYLNLLGGTYILDCLPETVIYNKILAEARKITNKKKTEAQKKQEEKEAEASKTPEKKEKKEKKRFGWFSLR